MAVDVEAEDVRGVLANGIDIGGEFHAARLAAATGVDLRLDHHRGAEFFGGSDGLIDRECHLAGAHRHPILGEELLALILEQIHRRCLPDRVRGDTRQRTSLSPLWRQERRHMPVARGPQMNARSAILVGITGVMIAVVLGGGVLFLANQSENVELQLGDTDFDAGQIGRISEEIDDRGPILYSDVAGRSRDIILQHLGDDPEAGWFAFDARPIGASRDCFFEWNSDAERFDLVLADGSDADCADVTMDERGNLSTGELIETYPVTIDDDNNVRVDINADRGAE